MALLRWSREYELGLDQVDDHHRHLVALLNKVYRDFNNGVLKHSMTRVVEELIDYAIYHFAAEEHWMSEHRYPELAEHRRQHDYFKQRIEEIRRDLTDGNGQLSLEVLTFLKNWVSNHILDSDADYGRFVQQQRSPA